MRVWSETVLGQSKDKPYVIACDNYNLRDYEVTYQLIASVYTNARVRIYPTKISIDGTDM